MNTELLAPVGSFEALKAAVENGANAVYLGGKVFSARQYAQNFDEETLKKAVEYCHIRDVKVFVTVNTLIAEDEFKELLEYILFLYEIDIDALIIQDLGVAKIVKDHFPDFEMHASTQMSVHNLEGVQLLEDMGFKRVVLSREMNIKEIQRIKENTHVDLEVFVHGALCISYSGQCLMSSMIGGRSGNRGRCAQPCRKSYDLINIDTGKKVKSNKGSYLLSPRDLNTLEQIDELLKIGVDSLKIEGRMKKPEYVATIIRAYRDAIDQYQKNKSIQVSKDTLKNIKQMFNRQFTKGYLLGTHQKDFMSLDQPNHRGIPIGKVVGYDKRRKKLKIDLEDTLYKGDGIQINTKNQQVGSIVEWVFVHGEKKDIGLKGQTIEIPFKNTVCKGDKVYKTLDIKLNQQERKTYEKSYKKISIEGIFKGKLGEKIELHLTDHNHLVKKIGSYEVEKAKNTATSYERILQQISKLGNTPYVLKDMKIELDENVAIPVKMINELRRNAIEALDEMRKDFNKRSPITLDSIVDKKTNHYATLKDDAMSVRVKVHNLEQLKAVLAFNVDRIYYTDLNTLGKAMDLASSHDIEVFPSLFRIADDEYMEKIKSILKKYEIQKIMVGNLGQVHSFKDNKEMYKMTDFSLNVFNGKSIEMLKDLNIQEVTLSAELTFKQIREILSYTSLPCEVIVHGNVAVMVSKYCPISSIMGNGEKCTDQRICEKMNMGLKDSLGAVFPIRRGPNCMTEILNSQKLCLMDHMKEFYNGGMRKIRIEFSKENKEEIKETLKAYTTVCEGIENKENIDDVVKNFMEKIKKDGITKGHFFRGVL